MGIEEELGNGLNELDPKDITREPIKTQSTTATKKSGGFFDWAKENKAKIVVAVIVLVWGVNKFIISPSSGRGPIVTNRTVQTQQNTQAQNSNQQNSAQASQKTEEKPSVTMPTTQNQTSTTAMQSTANTNQNSEANATVVESIDQWQSHIEYLFLTRPNVKLNMQYPIIEIGNLNFANNTRIDLKEQNAFVEPVYFTAQGNHIILNVKIIKADEPDISLIKSYNLSDYGFKPLYFPDSVIYNNEVFLPGDKILFFTLKAIQNQNNVTRVVFGYLDQDIVVVQENGQ